MNHANNTVSVPNKFWSIHSHSKYSVNDALPSVEAMVARAKELEYPALGLTDHGSVSGVVTLYKECRKVGIEPLPGIELYVVPDRLFAARKDSAHLTVVAYNEDGYRNLCALVTQAARGFHYKPLVDFADFAEMASQGMTAGLAVATGCFFGVLPQVYMNRGSKAASRVLETLAGWFPHVYVEVQNHGITATEHHSEQELGDTDLNAALYDLAQQTGLPMVATRDSHYVNPEDQKLHDALKRLVTWSDDLDDATFPGGGYFMTDYQGMNEYLDSRYLDAGMEGLNELASIANVRIPELESFSLKVPEVVSVGQDPQEVLRDKVYAVLDRGGLTPPYRHRLDDELDVISKQGMASYLLLVDQVCTWMRSKGISYHTRGSASGCMCNWLLDITQLDPIVFNLRFDRFLSSNRLKPPDIDLDVEHERRDEVVAYLNSRWSIRSIGNLMTYKLEEDDDQEHSHGSLRVKYFASKNRQGTPVANWRDISRADRDLLLSLAKLKLISGYGTHAAGYIVAPDEATVNQLPMSWIASSSKLVTSYGKKQVEQLGFLKLDLLGLRTRTAIKITEGLTGKGFDSIPLNDRFTYTTISKGKNSGVFQLEGKTMNYGCQQIKPKNIEDVIAIQALFRPGVMQSQGTQNYKDRRSGVEPVPLRNADIQKATHSTYGVMLYQEQVMSVLETLGMNKEELEEMLDAVKASNDYSAGAAVVIEEKMPRIRALAQGRGWSLDDIAWLVQSLASYAEYSFNRAHAAAYGVIAYRTAYMKKHYPVEFWTGMLTAYGNHDKELQYVRDARGDGVKILPANINASGVTYRMENNAIRKGFLSVKGVGPMAAEELADKAPYDSLDDLAERVVPRKVTGARNLALGKWPDECGGIIGHLEAAKALDNLDWRDNDLRDQ